MVVSFRNGTHAAQKMKFSIPDFFSKCDKIRRKLQIWSHLLKKTVMEKFIFCTVSWEHGTINSNKISFLLIT